MVDRRRHVRHSPSPRSRSPSYDLRPRIELFRSDADIAWMAELDEAEMRGECVHEALLRDEPPPVAKLRRWKPAVVTLRDGLPAVGPARYPGVGWLLQSWAKTVLIEMWDAPIDPKAILYEVRMRTRVAGSRRIGPGSMSGPRRWCQS